MFEKIKEGVESIRKQCELTERQLCINEQYKDISQDQDEIQKKVQLWDEELRHEERYDQQHEVLLDEAVPAA